MDKNNIINEYFEWMTNIVCGKRFSGKMTCCYYTDLIDYIGKKVTASMQAKLISAETTSTNTDMLLLHLPLETLDFTGFITPAVITTAICSR